MDSAGFDRAGVSRQYRAIKTSGANGTEALHVYGWESFVTFVRKPTSSGMPSFSDVAAKDLADLYAYLRSLHPAPPAADSIPLLKDILQQIQGR